MAYTTIDNPELFFQTKTYTGTGSSHAITLDGSENMQPDWVWIKNRQQTLNFMMWDSVRGTTKYFYSNLTEAEGTSSSVLTSFDSDGFTVGNNNNVNQSSNNIVAWNWKAGGSASSNSNGSITSSVSANTTAGFSIVSYTGTGSNATVGHGLGSVPKMMIHKDRDNSSYQWGVYHHSLGNQKNLNLNSTAAANNDSGGVYYNSTTPTSSVYSLGTNIGYNKASDTYISYIFSEVKGFSKFGSYTGNGNADGTFVYTGFKPAFLIIKRSSATEDWGLIDNKRDPNNDGSSSQLFPNGSNVEDTSNDRADFLSNGFKVRVTSPQWNGSGSTYIYMAFAESPFVNSNGVPTNAR